MSTSPYQYTVIFHEYQPYYHYTSTTKKKQSLGFLPAGVDFTYRNKRVSTITMMQLLHATIMTDMNSDIRRLRTILLQELPQSPLPKMVLYKMQQQLVL